MAATRRGKEARIGARVRVQADHAEISLRRREGTITQKWGHPDHAAVDVVLDDGRTVLFWHYELEDIS